MFAWQQGYTGLLVVILDGAYGVQEQGCTRNKSIGIYKFWLSPSAGMDFVFGVFFPGSLLIFILCPCGYLSWSFDEIWGVYNTRYLTCLLLLFLIFHLEGLTGLSMEANAETSTW